MIENIINLFEWYTARVFHSQGIRQRYSTKERRSNIMLDSVALAVLNFSRLIKIIADY